MAITLAFNVYGTFQILMASQLRLKFKRESC